MPPEEDKALAAEAHLIQEEVAAHQEFINLDQPHPEELSEEPTPAIPMEAPAEKTPTEAPAESTPAVVNETPAPAVAPAPTPALVVPEKPKSKSPFAAFTNLFRKKKKVTASAAVEPKTEAVDTPAQKESA